MNKPFIFILLWLLPAGALAQDADSVFLFCYFKGNGDGLHYAYSRDGFSWKAMNTAPVLIPAVGKDKLMRDPCIIRGSNGRFHMVWTVSWNQRGIGYAHSRNLAAWSKQRYLPVMEHEPAARNTWAPELTQDPQTGQFFIYWASTIEGRYPQQDTAAENGYNHRMYYTQTPDFKDFSPTQLLWDPGFSIIDATIVPHAGRFALFFKNETRAPEEKNIRVSFADAITGPFSQPSAPIHGAYWAEGPTVLKRGAQWIVYFDKYRNGSYGAVASTDLQTWQDVSHHLQMPPGLRHGTVFTISEKELATLQRALKRKKLLPLKF